MRINKVAETVIGQRTRRPRKPNSWYMNKELYAAINERRQAYNDWKAARAEVLSCTICHASPQAQADHARHSRYASVDVLYILFEMKKKACAALSRRLKLEATQAWMQSLDDMESGERQKCLKGISMKKKGHGSHRLGSKPEQLEAYRLHYEKTMSPTISTEEEYERLQTLTHQLQGHAQSQNQPQRLTQTTISFPHSTSNPVQGLYADKEETSKAVFNSMFIERCIRRAKKGKAAGKSKISIELIKPIAKSVSNAMQHMFRLYYDSSCAPSAWHRSLICPIHKKGDAKAISNYRPVSLTEVPRKLYETCLSNVVKSFIEPLDESQNGFREHRNTIDHLATLQHLILRRHTWLPQRNDGLVMAFLDIKNAYDKVDRSILWSKLLSPPAQQRQQGHARRACMPRHLIEALKSLFEENTSEVVVDGHVSAELQNDCGLLQGSVLSPTLYSFYIDDLPRRLRQHGNSLFANSGRTRLNALLFADDIALLAPSLDEMKKLLHICELHSLENNYRFSPSKCEVILDPSVYLQYSEEALSTYLSLYGSALKLSQSFTYLGYRIRYNGIDYQEQIQAQTEKASRATQLMRGVGFNGSGFGFRTKLDAYRAFIRPTMEYGLPIIPALKKLIKPMERAQHQALASLFGVHHSTSNLAMLAMSGMPSMSHRHALLNAKWREHLNNVSDGQFVRQSFLEAKADKTKSRNQNRNGPFQAALDNKLFLRYSNGSQQRTLENEQHHGRETPHQAPRNQRRNRPNKKRWKEASHQCQRDEMEMKLQKAPSGPVALMIRGTGCNGVQAHPILTMARMHNMHPMEQRNAILYLLGKFPGKPTHCRAGHGESHVNASPAHMLMCSGAQNYLDERYSRKSIAELFKPMCGKHLDWQQVRSGVALIHRMIACCLNFSIPTKLDPTQALNIPYGTLHPFTLLTSSCAMTETTLAPTTATATVQEKLADFPEDSGSSLTTTLQSIPSTQGTYALRLLAEIAHAYPSTAENSSSLHPTHQTVVDTSIPSIPHPPATSSSMVRMKHSEHKKVMGRIAPRQTLAEETEKRMRRTSSEKKANPAPPSPSASAPQSSCASAPPPSSASAPPSTTASAPSSTTASVPTPTLASAPTPTTASPPPPHTPEAAPAPLAEPLRPIIVEPPSTPGTVLLPPPAIEPPRSLTPARPLPLGIAPVPPPTIEPPSTQATGLPPPPTIMLHQPPRTPVRPSSTAVPTQTSSSSLSSRDKAATRHAMAPMHTTSGSSDGSSRPPIPPSLRIVTVLRPNTSYGLIMRNITENYIRTIAAPFWGFLACPSCSKLSLRPRGKSGTVPRCRCASCLRTCPLPLFAEPLKAAYEEYIGPLPTIEEEAAPKEAQDPDHELHAALDAMSELMVRMRNIVGTRRRHREEQQDVNDDEDEDEDGNKRPRIT